WREHDEPRARDPYGQNRRGAGGDASAGGRAELAGTEQGAGPRVALRPWSRRDFDRLTIAGSRRRRRHRGDGPCRVALPSGPGLAGQARHWCNRRDCRSAPIQTTASRWAGVCARTLHRGDRHPGGDPRPRGRGHLQPVAVHHAVWARPGPGTLRRFILTRLRWRERAGFTWPGKWRAPHLAVPLVAALALPIVGLSSRGIMPVIALVFALQVVFMLVDVFMEEATYRGLILEALAQYPAVSRVLICSLLFGLSHVDN